MYLQVDESFPDHRKTIRFCGLMKDPNAGMYLLRLWSWACRSAPDGDLAMLSPADIEIAVHYRKSDGACYAALVKSGFVDEREPGQPAALHNWMDRTGGSIRRMEDAAKASRERKRKWRERQDAAATDPRPGLPPDEPGTPMERVPERGRNGDGDAWERGKNAHRTDKASPSKARTDQDRPDQASPLDQDRSGSGPAGVSAVKLWGPAEWCRQFGLRWSKAKRGIFYGDARDSTGCAQLADIFERVGVEAQVLIQANAEEHFAAYLADDDPALMKAGHPFAWFVTRLTGMRTRQQAKRVGRAHVEATDRKVAEYRDAASKAPTPEEMADIRGLRSGTGGA